MKIKKIGFIYNITLDKKYLCINGKFYNVQNGYYQAKNVKNQYIMIKM